MNKNIIYIIFLINLDPYFQVALDDLKRLVCFSTVPINRSFAVLNCFTARPQLTELFTITRVLIVN